MDAIRLATEARESHKSADADWKEVHIRRQPAASIPEGPAAPSVLRQELRMTILHQDPQRSLHDRSLIMEA